MIIVAPHTSLFNLPDMCTNAEVCFLLLLWFAYGLLAAWSHLLFTWLCLDTCINLDSSLLCDVLRLIVYVKNPFFGFITRSCRATPPPTKKIGYGQFFLLFFSYFFLGFRP